MDPDDDDEQQAERPLRPPPRPLPYERLRQQVEEWLFQFRERRAARAAAEPAPRPAPFVSAEETVVRDVRRHPFVLAWPVVRTLTGLLALTGAGAFLLLFAVSTAAWAWQRFSTSLRRAAVVVGVAVVLVLLVSPPLAVVLLALLLAEDVADWLCDRLVVSDRRVYRRYGVITAHAPSISLTAIAFVDASVPPVGRLFDYGTLSLDSVAQRDAPLSRLDFLPDVIGVMHELLRLRAKAMPKMPPPQLY